MDTYTHCCDDAFQNHGRESSWNKGWRILPNGSGGFTLAKKGVFFQGSVLSAAAQFPIGATGLSR
jgi:hypothetical protein